MKIFNSVSQNYDFYHNFDFYLQILDMFPDTCLVLFIKGNNLSGFNVTFSPMTTGLARTRLYPELDLLSHNFIFLLILFLIFCLLVSKLKLFLSLTENLSLATDYLIVSIFYSIISYEFPITTTIYLHKT